MEAFSDYPVCINSVFHLDILFNKLFVGLYPVIRVQLMV